jgi:ATP-dependent DNA helicase RecG
MEKQDLSIEKVVWLDRIQKKLRVDDSQLAQLKREKLIEGKKPNYFVSAMVANATNTQAQYTKNRGLDDEYYKRLIIEHLKRFDTATVKDLRELIVNKLPDVLKPTQKHSKVKNLLTALRVHGLDGQKIVATSAGKGARWKILRH